MKMIYSKAFFRASTFWDSRSLKKTRNVDKVRWYPNLYSKKVTARHTETALCLSYAALCPLKESYKWFCLSSHLDYSILQFLTPSKFSPKVSEFERTPATAPKYSKIVAPNSITLRRSGNPSSTTNWSLSAADHICSTTIPQKRFAAFCHIYRQNTVAKYPSARVWSTVVKMDVCGREGHTDRSQTVNRTSRTT